MNRFMGIFLVSTLVIIITMLLVLHEHIHSTFCGYFNGESDGVIHFNGTDLYVTCKLKEDNQMLDMVNSFWDMITYVLFFIITLVYSMKFVDCLRDDDRRDKRREVSSNGVQGQN